MKTNYTWSRVLRNSGSIAMLAGAIDPLEGSILILAGSVLTALGTLLGKYERRVVIYRISVFVLIAFGVGAMWGLSNLGGIGGSTGSSYWWGILILPYLIGWYMGLWGPDSPRWMFWAGIAVGIWYLWLFVLISSHPSPRNLYNPGLSVILIAIGVITIAGSAYMLRKRVPKNQ